MKTSLISLILLAFSLHSYGQAIEKIVAKVNDEVVFLSDIENRYRAMISNDGYKAPGPAKCQILENILLEKVLIAEAKIDSVFAEDSQVDAELDRRMQYFIMQFGSEETLEQTYGMTTSQLKEELRDQIWEQLTVQSMQQTVLAEASVTPSEVRKFFKSIPRDSLPFYSSEVEVGQIVLKPEPSPVELAKAKSKLLEFKEMVLKGASFDSLAKRHSQDLGSARMGGDLGWQHRGQLVPEFEEVALKIKEGEIADPVLSEFGYHLIYLVKRRGNKFRAKHILIKPESGEPELKAAERKLDSLRNLLMIDSINFTATARDISDDAMTRMNAGYFANPGSGSLKVPTDQLDPVIFFMIDTMQVGSFSSPIRYRLEDGSEAARIVYYKSKTDAHFANLKQDYQRIYNAALSQKRGEIMEEWMKVSLKELFISIDPAYDYCNIMEKLDL
jgi:peptidyl-prolyl cis-trans isomerase SurA